MEAYNTDVFLQGELSKLKATSPVFLTIHDVGSSYKNWVSFTNHEDMKKTKDKSVFLHISLPGQQPAADDLDCGFPNMNTLAINLVTVLDQLGVKDRGVVVLGDCAGANIASRFAMYHPNRVYGLVLINCDPGTGGHCKPKRCRELCSAPCAQCALNLKNVKKYGESYKRREKITTKQLSKMAVETLLFAGAKSKPGSKRVAVKGSEEIMKKMKKGLCSIIRLSEVRNILEEAPKEAALAMILFCQGLSLLPAMSLEQLHSQGDRKQGRQREILMIGKSFNCNADNFTLNSMYF
jgi:protein NDRG1